MGGLGGGGTFASCKEEGDLISQPFGIEKVHMAFAFMLHIQSEYPPSSRDAMEIVDQKVISVSIYQSQVASN